VRCALVQIEASDAPRGILTVADVLVNRISNVNNALTG
jgi:hypothetical protein